MIGWALQLERFATFLGALDRGDESAIRIEKHTTRYFDLPGMARSILWRSATLRYDLIRAMAVHKNPYRCDVVYTMAISDPKVWRGLCYGDERP